MKNSQNDNIFLDQLRLVLDGMDALVYVTDMDTYEILFINEYGRKIWGDITGDLCWKSLQAGQGEPCDFCTNPKLLDKDGNPTGVHVWEIQNTINKQWYECRDHALRWPDGRTVRMEIATNITERKKNEEVLAETQRRLKNVLDAVPMVLWSIDKDGVFTLSEGKGLESLGLVPGQVVGMKLTDVYRDFPHIIESVQRGLDGEEFSEELDTGEKIWVSRIIPQRDENGNVTGLTGISFDVTERKQAEKEKKILEERVLYSQKLESLGVLAGGIAHDFNNLLVGVLGNADLALNELPHDSRALEYIQGIIQSSRRATELCGQMLAYSGRGKFFVYAVNISELVEEMTHMLEIAISKKITLKYEFGENLPAIQVDVTQIRQIIMNLITNASEAIGDKPGTINVRTGKKYLDIAYLNEVALDVVPPEGEYVFLEVTDDGSGMDDDVKEKLFEPFFTTKFTGRGLGLAAVLGIVRGHDGLVVVDSEPGRGSKFLIYMPASEVKPVKLPQELPESPDDSWRGEGVILLVDDEQTVLDVGKHMLTKSGFEVITASDGREGVESFRKWKDEIVLTVLDLTMPEMDGEECFREIREIDPEARIIMTSGYDEQDISLRFYDDKGGGFIQKPYRTSELLTVIRHILES